MAKESKDEQIGFHKGALATLAKEREEMQKILAIVEQLMQMHIKELKNLGVDLAAQAKEATTKKEGGKGKKTESSVWFQSGNVLISSTEQGQAEVLFEAIEKIGGIIFQIHIYHPDEFFRYEYF